MSKDIISIARFRDQLPFYVNGTLGQDECDEIEAYLKAHPRSADEMKFAQTVGMAARTIVTQRDPLAGYEAMKARLHQHQPTAAPSAMARLWNALWAHRGQWGFSPAAVFIIAILSVQIVITGSLVTDREAGTIYRGTAQVSHPPDLKLVVKPNVPFSALVSLLSQNQSKIVWGPSPSGELWLSVDDPAMLLTIRDRLTASPLVDDVIVFTRK